MISWSIVFSAATVLSPGNIDLRHPVDCLSHARVCEQLVRDGFVETGGNIDLRPMCDRLLVESGLGVIAAHTPRCLLRWNISN